LPQPNAYSRFFGPRTLVLYDEYRAKGTQGSTQPTLAVKDVAELAIAGVGFGTVNGLILAGVFKLLETTVGIAWMLAD
jgi:hypothetical protein